MYNTEYDDRYDAIDIDPYGSMMPYINSALKAIHNNGLLCLTSTDTKVLCGSDKHKCYYMYGAARGGNSNIEETGIRIVLGAISRAAGLMSKSIKVLLSVHSEFYIRVFVQVRGSKKEAGESMANNGIQLYCDKCQKITHHTFGSINEKGKLSVNPWSYGGSCCDSCANHLKLSRINRRTVMDWRTIRYDVC